MEMTNRVDKFVDRIRNEAKNEPATEIEKSVETLRLLRHVCREIVLRFDAARSLSGAKRKIGKDSILFRKAEEARSWPHMVHDIDRTLHKFKYRHVAQPPKFRSRGSRKAGDFGNTTDDDDEDNSKLILKSERIETPKEPRVATSKERFLESCFQTLPKLQPYEEDRVIPDSDRLNLQDEILIRLHDKRVRGSIVQVVDQMRALYLSYEDLPSFFEEFQPVEEVEYPEDIQGCGEPSSSDAGQIYMTRDSSGSNQIVRCKVGGQGQVSRKYSKFCSNSTIILRIRLKSITSQPRRAIVRLSRCATFYLVKLKIGSRECHRWFARDSIIEKWNIESREEPSTLEHDSTLENEGRNDPMIVDESNQICTSSVAQVA